jgi:nucleotide-binding universal stress UspA family protein
MYTRIVVPLDGSDIAETAITQAETMATLTGAPLHLTRVVDLNGRDAVSLYGMLADPTAIDTYLKDELDAARQYLEATRQRLIQRGFQVTVELRRGAVIRGLLDSLLPGDLLVMASHGRSGMSRWFLGSVAEDLIRRSPVPVLLVRANVAATAGTGLMEKQPLVHATIG